ncbi:hypothetical protein [Chryseolinea lacunae]|uniref:Signal peptide-containing protein n=1 Tax=Chryseolinea lacunae TaxID=2801331 RepID=A0ABS1KMT6_9BACT|nr:hypothetical protein [Chryseolinea lacunae]MBL0740756.1 hypothetical protein [Chryseolinea lacunae]
MAKKILMLPVLIVLACVIAGVYGMLHDQLTYTISPEYFTQYKFQQFQLIGVETHSPLPNPRIAVSLVGLLATWWTGIPIGLILGLVGLVHKSPRNIFRVTLKAFLITIVISFLTGLVGLSFAHFYLVKEPIDYYVALPPDNPADVRDFIKVGMMHNFSYAGGFIGMLVGIAFILNQRRKMKKKEPD